MKNDELAEYGLKECTECYGTGEIPDSYHDKTGHGDICPDCEGSGYVPYTEEDVLNDKENENISNDEIKRDN
jgi:DnaJ-class molecular chaperone